MLQIILVDNLIINTLVFLVRLGKVQDFGVRIEVY